MNHLKTKRIIYGRKSIGGVNTNSLQKGRDYFPFTPDSFFLLFLRKLYHLNLEDEQMQNYESWMKYIFENQSHSEIYVQ